MKIVPILSALLVLAGIYVFIFERDRFMPAAPPTEMAEADIAPAAAPDATPMERAVPVVIQPSTAQTVASGVILRGRTEATRRVDVRAETTGTVISEPLASGTMVSAGQLLCELDPGTRNAQLAQARAALEEARLNDQASSTLAERGFGSETTAAARRAQLGAALAAVEQAEKEIERLRITAPFAGTLETETAELGALLQPGSACATVMSLDRIRFVGFVPELEVARIAIGSPVEVRMIDGTTVSGDVTFVANSADPATRTFRIEAEVDNTDRRIRDGATAEISIAISAGEAHFLPQAALTLDDAGQIGVRIVRDGAAYFVPTTVIRDEMNGVWLGGLPDQADVIIVGQEFVNDGRSVRPVRADEVLQ
ncbi:multidrug efflux system membrane fusion protein [Rubricella aquisinus]|uniref:Multidrug efflux system membrane fusion protein n=1 Tax=Rubricella aquisinus TaxID=2028108 RepID=A0A840WZD1_9RHOB|nr:efflux RND transporter periplasmic adaptor subunit [Rubricella aquisinus]MBB5516500.1 multidrug efflux system membrane fusion protein [Rubricella aquisinus]